MPVADFKLYEDLWQELSGIIAKSILHNCERVHIQSPVGNVE